MNRRDALKALTSVAGAAGLTVTPVTTQEAQGVELVLLKPASPMSMNQMELLRQVWQDAVQGTALAETKALILDDVDVEFVRTK
jgi:hypothetical protein